MKIISTVILIIIATVVFSFASIWVGKRIDNSITEMEIDECRKFELWSQEYENFYYTPWQAEMCRKHYFIINAPIKDELK